MKPAGTTSGRFYFARLELRSCFSKLPLGLLDSKGVTMTWRNTTENHGRITIWLHWITAILIVAMITLGIVMTEPQSDPDLRLLLLRLHSAIGATLLILIFFRLLWRMSNPTPKLPDSMHMIEKAAARTVHLLLLVVIVVMLLSGAMTLLFSGAFNTVLNGFGELPKDFESYPQRHVHGIGAIVLLLLVVAHTTAAFYHHFFKKDDVLKRMLGRH